MRQETSRWIHEARLGVEKAKEEFTRNSSLTADHCRMLCNGVERAVKAPLVEKYGDVPKEYWHHTLVQLCKVTGLWQSMPPHLQSVVQTLAPYTPNVSYPSEKAFATLVAGGEDWGSRLGEAGELVDHVQHFITATSSGFPNPRP